MPLEEDNWLAYVRTPQGPSQIARSADGGRTFDANREYVITDSYLLEDCGYPSTVCLEDGAVVTLAYTVFALDHPDWGTCCVAYRYPQALFDL